MEMGFSYHKAMFGVCIFLSHFSKLFSASVTAENVEGLEGKPIILPCTATGNEELVWRRGELIILVKLPNSPVNIPEKNNPYHGEVSLEGGTGLRIHSLDRDRDEYRSAGTGSFLCLQGGMELQRIRLAVLVRITGILIVGASGGTINATEDEYEALTCTVTGDPNPAPVYSWRVDGDVMMVTSHSPTTLQLRARKSTKAVTCTATNTFNNGTELSREAVTVDVNVQYLDLPSFEANVTVVEGINATLRCSAEGNPLPKYEWTKVSPRRKVVSMSSVFTMEKVLRSAAGEYRCTVSNSVRSFQRMTNLVVQYPPVVTTTFDEPDHTLTCTARGVPASYSFGPWEHSLGGKQLRAWTIHSTQSPASLRLTEILTFNDTGYYRCQVTNGIKETQSDQIYLSPESAAIFQSVGSVNIMSGKAATIRIPFYTHSKTPNVMVKWRKSGESRSISSHSEEIGPVHLVILDKNVSIEGTVTVLRLAEVTPADEGNYTVTVTNAINAVPRSREITVRVKVTKSKIELTPGTAFPVGPIAGGVGGAVVLIVIIVAVVVLARRRKAARQKDGVSNADVKYENHNVDAEKTGFDDPRWKAPDAELVDNDLYQPFDANRSPAAHHDPKTSTKAVPEVSIKTGAKKKKRKGDKQKAKSAGIVSSDKTNLAEEADTGQQAKKPGLTYAEVEFSKGSAHPAIQPTVRPQDPVTYASIQQKQKKRRK